MKMLSNIVTTFLNGSKLLNCMAGITSIFLFMTLTLGNNFDIPVILGDDSLKSILELQFLSGISWFFWLIYIIFKWTKDQESALKSLNLIVCTLYNLIIANNLAQQYPPYDALIDILVILSIFYSICSLSLISHEIGQGDEDNDINSNNK